MKPKIYYGVFDRKGNIGVNYDGRLLIYTGKKFAKRRMSMFIDPKGMILPITLNIKV